MISRALKKTQVSSDVLRKTLHVPMSFFDAKMTGDIVRLFSSDLDVVDRKLPATISDTLICFFLVATNLLIISYHMPIIVFFFLPIIAAIFLVQNLYSSTKIQLKQLGSTYQGAINSKFLEAYLGTRYLNYAATSCLASRTGIYSTTT